MIGNVGPFSLSCLGLRGKHAKVLFNEYIIKLLRLALVRASDENG